MKQVSPRGVKMVDHVGSPLLTPDSWLLTPVFPRRFL